jgi:hypothetical protein
MMLRYAVSGTAPHTRGATGPQQVAEEDLPPMNAE